MFFANAKHYGSDTTEERDTAAERLRSRQLHPQRYEREETMREITVNIMDADEDSLQKITEYYQKKDETWTLKEMASVLLSRAISEAVEKIQPNEN